MKKLFKSILNVFCKSSSSSSSGDAEINIHANARIELAELVKLGALISNNEKSVMDSLTLYVENPEKYFELRSNEYFDLDSIDEVHPELPLIESLIAVKKMVYVDHAQEADEVLMMLDDTVNGELSRDPDFVKFCSEYESHGRENTIGNFMDCPSMMPKPYELTEKCGYSLFQLDEGSDSYPLFLAKPIDVSEIIKLAKKVGFKVKHYTK